MAKDKSSIIIFILVVLLTAVLLFFLFWKKDSGNSDTKKNPKVQAGDNFVYGPGNAPITMIEFSDYQCPYCKTNSATIAKILEKYPKDIKFIFRDFPLEIHPNARPAAYAAEAAGKQNKYYEYHKLLFEMQDDWASLTDPTSKFLEYAKILNLDLEKFKKDMSLQSIKDNVEEDFKFGQSLDIQGTPVLYINDTKLVGAQTFQALEEAILDHLSL